MTPGAAAETETRIRIAATTTPSRLLGTSPDLSGGPLTKYVQAVIPCRQRG